MHQRERKKKSWGRMCRRKELCFGSLHQSSWNSLQTRIIISLQQKKIQKAANNSSRIPDLPTGYVNNINLIANEL